MNSQDSGTYDEDTLVVSCHGQKNFLVLVIEIDAFIEEDVRLLRHKSQAL